MEVFVRDFIAHEHELQLEESSGNALLKLLSNTKYFNWDEYFIVGMKFLGSLNQNLPAKWFRSAIDNFNRKRDDKNMKILEYISQWAVKTRNADLAIKASTEILELDQNHQSAKQIKTSLETGNPEDLYIVDHFGRGGYKTSMEYKIYEKLCNNVIERKPANVKHLSCKYKIVATPIDPVKMEEINSDPEIVLYHDVVYDSEFESVNLNVNVKRSNVFKGDDDEVEETSFRTSNEFHINKDDNNYFLNKISTRVTQLTKLLLDYESGTTIINYEVGNQYAPHWDFYRSHEMQSYCDYVGNRIATVLIYVSIP